jgi:hypothetical protein
MHIQSYVYMSVVQGGFLLCKPDLMTFHALVDIVQEGNWAPGSGWGGTTNNQLLSQSALLKYVM